MEQIIFEMETADPDDFMTLLWLADHPDVALIGVVVTPGSHDQCQLVRWGLDRCGKRHIDPARLKHRLRPKHRLLKARYFAGNKAKCWRIVFFGIIQGDLHTEANAQHRTTIANHLAQGFV